MAKQVVLTRNLKLRVSPGLTADAKYNLDRLDALGSTFLVDSENGLNIRSINDILLEPNSADVGGSGVGGILNIGTTSHDLDEVNIYSLAVNLDSPIGLLDQSVGGTKYLRIQYNSTLSGSIDTTADRALSIDLEGADRQLVLAGNLSLLVGDLIFTAQNASSSYLLPAGAAGTLATLANPETLTNKTFDADANIVSNVRNANVASNAAIDYSKLNLSLSILNSDVSGSAGIVYSKLSLAHSIIDNDIANAAGIVYSKLNLVGQIVNNDIAANAAIDYSKLYLTGSIKGSDIASGAAIPGSAVNPDFGNNNIVTSGTIGLRNGSSRITSFSANAAQAVNIPFTLPDIPPTGNQVLRANASTPTLLEWASVSGTGTVTSVDATVPTNEFAVSGTPITSAGTIAITTLTQLAGSVWAGPTSGGATQPAFRALVATDLPVGTVIGVTDTASVDLTITANSLSAVVLPAGVNHNALANYVASQHVDHASVAIATSATSGLAGGGDLQLTRNIVVAPDNAVLKASPVAADEVLIADSGSGNALKKATLGSIIAAVGGGVFATNWIGGTSFTATHNFGSKDVDAILYDNSTGERVYPDTEIRSSTNQVDFTVSVAPSNLRVIIKLLI